MMSSRNRDETSEVCRLQLTNLGEQGLLQAHLSPPEAASQLIIQAQHDAPAQQAQHISDLVYKSDMGTK